MNGRAPDFTAHAPFQDFMNGRMGAFRHKGNVKADYMKKAATTALIHVFYTCLIRACLLKVLTCNGMEAFLIILKGNLRQLRIYWTV